MIRWHNVKVKIKMMVTCCMNRNRIVDAAKAACEEYILSMPSEA